jgi:hypothetical protein
MVEVYEKSLAIRHFRAFSYPKEAAPVLSGAAGLEAGYTIKSCPADQTGNPG